MIVPRLLSIDRVEVCPTPDQIHHPDLASATDFGWRSGFWIAQRFWVAQRFERCDKRLAVGWALAPEVL